MSLVFNHSKSAYGVYGNWADVKFARVNATADGDNTVIAAVTNKKIRILNIQATSTTSATSTFKSGASTTLFTWQSAANGQIFLGAFPFFIFETATGEAFVISTTAGQDITGLVTYVEVSPVVP